MRIAVIGGGISGLSCAQLLKDRYDVTVFEREKTAGGLVRCERVDDSLFHICGGHVFNSKRQDVMDWFWSRFDRDQEFVKADRNSVIIMENGSVIPYPIENHFYLFDKDMQKCVIEDLVKNARNPNVTPRHFEEFLKARFGDTLYHLYFRPYNEKVWKRDLSKVPLKWLEGKLPMPTIEEIIFNNINHVKERLFVHSSFWYAKKNGSQFIVDRLAEGINIRTHSEVAELKLINKKWYIHDEEFDSVIFCGNIRQLPEMLKGVDLQGYTDAIDALEYHGTTAVFCEIAENPYSWIYLPSHQYESHRIICTGNFSSQNNGGRKMTATVEFTDEISKDDIIHNLHHIPLAPRYIAHHYNQHTYPIQDQNTREMILSLKSRLGKLGFYFTGRFADWEYYNMDVAMGAAMDLVKNINNNS